MLSNDFNVVLYQPVIPQNTGSIARLCACTGAALHLIHPLGFHVDEASVKRAGLDYWPHVEIHHYENWEHFLAKAGKTPLYFFSKFAKTPYTQAPIQKHSALVFGSETTGLPDGLRHDFPNAFYKVPMRTHLVRSLNLAQTASVVVYEALRQNDFQGDQLS